MTVIFGCVPKVYAEEILEETFFNLMHKTLQKVHLKSILNNYEVTAAAPNEVLRSLPLENSSDRETQCPWP